MPAWLQIDLGDEYLIHKVVFGSEHTSYFHDRAATKFKIFVTKEYNSNSFPSKEWQEIFSYDNSDKPIRNTSEFLFTPVEARYVRVYIEKSGREVRVDEIEIYGKSK